VATAQLPVSPPVRLLDDSFLRFLPAPLREPSSGWKTLAIAPVLTVPISLVLSFLVTTYLPNLTTPVFRKTHWLIEVFNIVILSPVVETLLMAGILAIILKFLSKPQAIIASAVIWGGLHSLVASAWGLIVWWPFIIFSTIYLTWKQRGFWHGCAMAAAVHVVHNLISLGLIKLLLRS